MPVPINSSLLVVVVVGDKVGPECREVDSRGRGRRESHARVDAGGAGAAGELSLRVYGTRCNRTRGVNMQSCADMATGSCAAREDHFVDWLHIVLVRVSGTGGLPWSTAGLGLGVQG